MESTQRNLRFYGSALSLADVDPKNSYGWMLSLKKGSPASFLISIFGVPHLGARIRHRVLTKILDKPQKGESVLDVGCGFGLESLCLSRKGYKVVGFDLSKPKIEVAKKLNKELDESSKFIVADIFKTEKIKNKFDKVILFEILEHVRKPGEILAKISTYLKNGGLVIASFPSKHPINAMSKEHLGHEVVGYEIDEISKMVGKNMIVKRVYNFGNSFLAKCIFYIDLFLLRGAPLISAALFFLFYPLIVFDTEMFASKKPLGYVVVLKKAI